MAYDFDGIELPKKSAGRPQSEINYDAIERAAAIGCTKEEIAAVIGVSRATLYNHMEVDPEIQAAIDRGQDVGKATLRRAQWRGAMEGNPTMLTWLGKQMLGQRDTQSLQQLDKNGQPTDAPPTRVVVELVGR